MRPVYRSKKHKQLISTLTAKHPTTDVAAFPSIKELQCYAAMLGFEENRREAFERKDVDDITWDTMEGKTEASNYTPYVYLIALAETNNVGVLRYNIEESDTGGFAEDMVKIFEEYAHAGFNILQRWVNKKAGDAYGATALIQGIKEAGYLDERDARQSFDEVIF